MTNAQIAMTFEEIAVLLDHQGASTHRARAWRQAARAIRDHDSELSDVFHDHGKAGLEAIPRIGPRLASVIIDLVTTGHCGALDRLRGDGIEVLKRIPAIGPKLAERIHHDLGIETLEELEAAAHDGRLATVEGFGDRRIETVRDVLATRLGRRRPSELVARPPVATLLDIDREYRRAAEAGELRRIAPRRFNPNHEAWLPILHTDRNGWSFTALYSNTQLAHQLGRTHDWVIIYYHPYHQPHPAEGQATIVTERNGHQQGQRVVRGREAECASYDARRALVQSPDWTRLMESL
jgi:DNA polymerase (family X)